ncbi:amidohydrolase [Arthrobacter castelli]|uniref:amidohydrolase n=1 Tax=Arthrobacter castelli TaxID=271431 RepID=UPI0003F52077|nr:amidohydrolase family protein [Arthrobacter castelli]
MSATTGGQPVSPQQSPQSRVTMYRNGSVYSAADPFATAMLVDGGTVAWVGTEQAAASIADSSMAVVDLEGSLVAPGFVDSHIHVTETGIADQTLDLAQMKSLAELLDAVAGAARSGDGMILGHGWDETQWPEGRAPTADELDRASGSRIVYLSRIDVHSAVVSGTLAADLSLANFDGWYGDGQVSGHALSEAREASRTFRPGERRQFQQRALSKAASAGYVALAEMSAPHVGAAEDLQLLMSYDGQAEADGGALRYPAILPYWGEAAADADDARRILSSVGVPVRGLAGDLNIDGSIGSRTALLRDDYSDQPGERGSAYLDTDLVASHFAATAELGIQGGFHVIGDAAMDIAVEALHKAAAQVGIDRVRAAHHRLEHAEMLSGAVIEQLAHFAVTASVQPVFDALWGKDDLYHRRLGPARAGAMNPFASMLSAGVPLTIGTDAPVTELDPWAAVRACLQHSNPDQRISARAAFLAHTRAGWRAAGAHDPLAGQLVPGAPATFAVWDVDELMVQAPDERVQSWSTDPRAGTPLLPALDDGQRPVCLQTVRDGWELYSRW